MIKNDKSRFDKDLQEAMDNWDRIMKPIIVKLKEMWGYDQ